MRPEAKSLALGQECLTQEAAHPCGASVAPPVKQWSAQHSEAGRAVR